MKGNVNPEAFRHLSDSLKIRASCLKYNHRLWNKYIDQAVTVKSYN